FSNLDLISCRNVLIYLGPTLQKRVIPTFHYALKPDGFLLLGGSESLGSFTEHFSLIDKKQKIYQKKGSATRLLSYFAGAGPTTVRRFEEPPTPRPASSPNESEKEIERSLVQHYAPTSIVVNSHMEIVQFRGRTGAYLEPAEGQPTFSLSKMAREGLLVDLRRAIERAKKENAPVHIEDVQVKNNGGTRGVNIDVIPIRSHNANDRFYVVAFHDAQSRQKDKPSKAGKVKLSQKQAEVARENDRLKREIASMKEQMRALIEENESTTEEYKSANEEVLSANEELQSTNEELETAKEELQSSNEELTTLNEELQNRNAELTLANNDLTNLLGNVNIPVVMIGDDLRIRRFTPPAQKLLNLLPGDIGRRLGEIRPNIDFDQLEELAREAIDNTSLQEREVRDKEGQRWHLLRVRPYKTWDNKIDGAVISLQDIHALKATAEQSRTYTDTLIETSRESILILDTNLRVTVANPTFYRTFRVSPAGTQGQLIYALADGQWDIPELHQLFEQVLNANASVQEYEITHDFPDAGHKTLLISARRADVQPGEGGIVVTIDDVTEEKQHGEEISHQAALIELAHESVIVRDWEGRIRSWNRGAEELYGWRADEARGKIIHDLLRTKFPLPLGELKEQLRRTGHWEGELLHTRRDGEERVVSSRWALRQASNTPMVLEINIDLTDRVRSEQNLRELSTYLMRIQDEERRRIARELHDSTGQKLAAVKMNIEAMKAAPKGKTKPSNILSESIQLVDEASQEIRVLAQLLHPPLLDEAGLVSAIKWLVDGFTTRAKMPVNVKASPDLGRLPDNAEIALFRIVQ
ncbi:MAG: PAS domain-containing protein, partial [Acidobacteriaceae bacterium]|nr:PAS domain-containing protein [Acidobacteriaceae bacterium]